MLHRLAGSHSTTTTRRPVRPWLRHDANYRIVTTKPEEQFGNGLRENVPMATDSRIKTHLYIFLILIFLWSYYLWNVSPPLHTLQKHTLVWELFNGNRGYDRGRDRGRDRGHDHGHAPLLAP